VDQDRAGVNVLESIVLRGEVLGPQDGAVAGLQGGDVTVGEAHERSAAGD